MLYLLLVTAFVITSIGVVGDTFDKERRRPTWQGWVTIGAAGIACLVSVYFEYSGSREKHARAYIANSEFVKAAEIIVLPFLMAQPKEHRDPFWNIEAEGKESFLLLRSREFVDQMPDANSDRYAKFNADVHQAAKLFSERIDSIIQSHDKDLNAETIQLLNELQRDPFIENAARLNTGTYIDSYYLSFMGKLAHAFERVEIEIVNYRSENR